MIETNSRYAAMLMRIAPLLPFYSSKSYVVRETTESGFPPEGPRQVFLAEGNELLIFWAAKSHRGRGQVLQHLEGLVELAVDRRTMRHRAVPQPRRMHG